MQFNRLDSIEPSVSNDAKFCLHLKSTCMRTRKLKQKIKFQQQNYSIEWGEKSKKKELETHAHKKSEEKKNRIKVLIWNSIHRHLIYLWMQMGHSCGWAFNSSNQVFDTNLSSWDEPFHLIWFGEIPFSWNNLQKIIVILLFS